MSEKKIDIIGIGMGACDLLTQQARLKIEQAQVIIGAKRMIELGKRIKGDKGEFIVEISPDNILEKIRECEEGNIVVLMSGDTGFYSGAKVLSEKLEKWSVNMIPGISSLSYFCAKLGMAYEDVKVLSLHGRRGNMISYVRRNENTFILTEGNVGEICGRLLEYEFEDVQIAVGENLSYASERILRGKPLDFVDKSFSSTTVMLINNPAWNDRIETGISDDRFIRGNVPMTKSAVRSIVLSKLSLGEEEIAYDIGAGTGSVSVEMALCAWRGHVYAVECSHEGVKLIKENQRKFQCDNIHRVEGMAPEVLEKLPAPDAVFIGGSRGNMDSILQVVFQKLINTSKACRVVWTAVTLETLTESLGMLEKWKLKQVEMLQVSTANVKAVGNYHMLQGENPVYMISGVMDFH